MFLIVNSYHTVLRNVTIRAQATHPLHTAIEYASSKGSPPEPSCTGRSQPASKNTVEHVEIVGGGLNDLMYGVRLTNRYGYDANNDMTRIVNVNMSNITAAAVSVESTQSHQNELIDVTAYGAPGNRGCFLHAETGFVSSIGGFQGLWGKAAFCLNGAYGPFTILNADSEGCGRLIAVGEVGDIARYPVSVSVDGGRFAVDAMNSDGYVVSFNRLGSLIVRGLRIDGVAAKGVAPSISVQPGRIENARPGVSAIVEGTVFFVNGSNTWNTVVAPSWATVSERGNICLDVDGLATTCRRSRFADARTPPSH
jgi:hypothetical protein